MITTELISFINKEVISGKTKEQIKSELLASGGWTTEDIEESFLSINGRDISTRKVSIYLKIFVYLIFYIPSLVFLFSAISFLAAGVGLIVTFGGDNLGLFYGIMLSALLFFLFLSIGLFKIINFVFNSYQQKHYSGLVVSIVVILIPFLLGLSIIINNGLFATFRHIYEILIF